MQRVKIRRSQVWRKKDTGQMIIIMRNDRGGAWKTLRMDKGSSKHKVHKIMEHDINKFYELV